MTVSGAQMSATFRTLTPGRTYSFTATATNAAGSSPTSAPSNPATPPVLPGPGSYGLLSRYFNPVVPDRWSATGQPPAGYQFEGSLGALLMVPAAGTQVLYACAAGSDEFTSLSSSCEGQRVLGPLGFDYKSARASLPTVGLYRCRVTATGEHFDSNDAGCEGQSVEGNLGYVAGGL